MKTILDKTFPFVKFYIGTHYKTFYISYVNPFGVIIHFRNKLLHEYIPSYWLIEFYKIYINNIKVYEKYIR